MNLFDSELLITVSHQAVAEQDGKRSASSQKRADNSQLQIYEFDASSETEAFNFSMESMIDSLLPEKSMSSNDFNVTSLSEGTQNGERTDLDDNALQMRSIIGDVENHLTICQRFITRYLTYTPTTVEENGEWMRIERQGTNRKTYFLFIESSQLKHLNDTLKHKNLVTSLTNYHKKTVMKEMKTLQDESPKMKINAYSDYKSLRFSFTDDLPPNLHERVSQIVQRASDAFSNHVRSWKIIRETDQTDRWFCVGFGESADQANIAARYSRGTATNYFQPYEEYTLKIVLEHDLRVIEKTRQILRCMFKDTLVLDENTVHENVFQIVRKNIDCEQAICDAVRRHFGVNAISFETINILREYVRLINVFRPCLYFHKREFANMDNAKFGGFSADVIGFGAKNLKATAEAIAGRTNIEEVFTHTRAAERVVTAQLMAQQTHLESTLRKANVSWKLETTFSGDDYVARAIEPITDEEKEAILFQLNNGDFAGLYRLAFVPAGVIDSDARSLLSVHGENIEKLLRASLDYDLAPNRLRSLTFGIDMRTREVNQGTVRLILVGSQKITLTVDEHRIIQRHFEETIRQANMLLETQYQAMC